MHCQNFEVSPVLEALACLVVHEHSAAGLDLGLVYKGHDGDIILWPNRRGNNGMAAAMEGFSPN